MTKLQIKPAANSRLTMACSALWRAFIATANAWDDLRLFGAPSECGGLIGESHDRKLAAILAEHGFTAGELMQALRDRGLPEYWLYEYFSEIEAMTYDS